MFFFFLRSFPVRLSLCASLQMRFMLLFSRQGKLRLQKWYTATAERDKKKMVRELMQVVLARKPKMCSFLEWRDLKIVYKRQKTTHAHLLTEMFIANVSQLFSSSHIKTRLSKIKAAGLKMVHSQYTFSCSVSLFLSLARLFLLKLCNCSEAYIKLL